MRIMNRLTRKHMLTNKKRTLVTILGIIISVAMFTAVFTGVTSILDFFQKNEMSNTGFWHVEYQGINTESADMLKDDSNTKNISYYKDLGYSKFEDSSNELKPYLYLSAMDDHGYDMMNIKLIEGRFPANDDEILIPEHLLKYSDHEYKVGDTITLTLGYRYIDFGGEIEYLNQNSSFKEATDNTIGEKFETTAGEKEYTIVGITERPKYEYNWAPGFSVFTKLEDLNQCNARIYLKNVTKDIYEDSQDIQEDNQIATVEYNNPVLSYYGISRYRGFNQMINGLIIILVIIIMVGSISLIYNSFAISISEGAKQFGMLSSVGATKKQKLYAVLYEGIVCGCISIPIGILSGILGLNITFQIISPMIKQAFTVEQSLTTVVSVQGIIAAVIISMITILLSAYLPARKASKITPMEAIRQQKDIKIKGKTVKNMKLVRKLFGLEGDLALKNLKRNKRRYRAIVFSLGISIILFISVNSFTYYLSKSIEVAKGTNSGDLEISSFTAEEIDTILPELSEMETLTDLTIHAYLPKYYTMSESDTEKYAADELKEYCNQSGLVNPKIGFLIVVVDDEYYQKLQEETKSVGTTVEDNIVPIMLVNQQRSMADYSVKDIKPLKISDGTILYVSSLIGEAGE
ncbi:MAG: FtsX-like permease family protein, partial [Clostridiales bacterium]|nr:FtsX-like permease family protein [Clostridiales bacterium]